MNPVVEEVRQKVDILAVIGEYVDLKRAGTSVYRGLCPLHQEKTASFTVNPVRQTFHCFGCSSGGDVFTFIMKHQRVEFPDALEFLAKKAGVEIAKGRGNGGNRMIAMNAAAVEFYRKNLLTNPQVLAYLKETRGLLDESIERFALGCDGQNPIWQHLRECGYSEKEIIDNSLGKKKDGQLVDYFMSRIIFPIKFLGGVRGFGGRVIDDSLPKYLNSRASETFSKKDILYGLDPTGIKDKGYALITEGYLDVIMAHQHNYRNTVAPMGTALTTDQITLLRKYCDDMFPVFDGDAAGERAAVKAAYFMFMAEMSGGIVILPSGEDLDSFLRQGGDLETLIIKAVPFSVYLSMKSPGLRREVLKRLMFRSPIESAEFLAYKSTPEERRMTAEMSAREGMSKFFPKAAMVVQCNDNDVEIRRRSGFLALFSAGGFKMMEEEVGSDFMKQAATLLNKYLELKKTYQKEKQKK
jgi:DNA primase